MEDRPGAAKRLVEQLRAGTVAGRTDAPVVVVVEGAARAGVPEGNGDGVNVLHTTGRGDNLIAELAASHPGRAQAGRAGLGRPRAQPAGRCRYSHQCWPRLALRSPRWP